MGTMRSVALRTACHRLKKGMEGADSHHSPVLLEVTEGAECLHLHLSLLWIAELVGIRLRRPRPHRHQNHLHNLMMQIAKLAAAQRMVMEDADSHDALPVAMEGAALLLRARMWIVALAQKPL